MKPSKNGFFSNWQIGVLCFLFAILVYFIMAYAVDSRREISLPLQIQMPSGYQPSSVVPQTAKVVIVGSEDKIYMIDASKIKLYADFSDVKDKGVASAVVRVDCSGLMDYLDITGISVFSKPSVVKIYFE